MTPTIYHLLHHVASTAQAACGRGQSCDTGLPTIDATSGQLHQVLQIVFGIMGAMAVLMLVISGLRFVTAQGNPQEISKARNTIIYSLVGLTVAIAAEAIVSLVLSKL